MGLLCHEVAALGQRKDCILTSWKARSRMPIGVAGQVDALARALQEGEQRRVRLVRDLATLDHSSPVSADAATRVERDLRNRLKEWRQMLGRHTPLSRQIVMRLLDGKIAWTPHRDAGVYAFTGKATYDQLLSGLVVPQGVVAVRGFEPRFRG
jgi:hypothetical protein